MVLDPRLDLCPGSLREPAMTMCIGIAVRFYGRKSQWMEIGEGPLTMAYENGRKSFGMLSGNFWASIPGRSPRLGMCSEVSNPAKQVVCGTFCHAIYLVFSCQHGYLDMRYQPYDRPRYKC